MSTISTTNSGWFSFSGRTSSNNTTVVLQPKFKQEILKKAYRIISNPNFVCPPEVKSAFIAKHNLEPGKLQKIITKICKPTSKIVASFTVEWIVSPAISALCLSKIITAFPSLAILGTSYWTAVTVSLTSLAIYPILIISFGAAAKGGIILYRITADRVHRFVMSFRNPQNQPPRVNLSVDFENLTRVIIYDNRTNSFYLERPGSSTINGSANTRDEVLPYVVESIMKKASKLEKYSILLSGDNAAIRRTFQSSIPDASQSLPTSVDIKALKNQIKAVRGLDELCSNSEAQYNLKYVLNYLVKDCAKKAAAERMRTMQSA